MTTAKNKRYRWKITPQRLLRKLRTEQLTWERESKACPPTSLSGAKSYGTEQGFRWALEIVAEACEEI